MPKRSAIYELPDEVRKELEKRLITGGFSKFQELSEWLAEEGFEISKSSIHRYGQKFDDRLSAIKIATEQAQAIAESSKDDEGAMSEALTRLVQEKIFTALIKMEEPGEVSLSKIGKTVADLTRASVSQKKWMLEMREKTRKVISDAEEKSPEMSKDELLTFIRERVYGLL